MRFPGITRSPGSKNNVHARFAVVVVVGVVVGVKKHEFPQGSPTPSRAMGEYAGSARARNATDLFAVSVGSIPTSRPIPRIGEWRYLITF